jgi:micrococcal nuclease
VAALRVCALLLVLAAVGCSAAPAEEPAATTAVARVIDGDTVVLRGVGRARLIGVDSPEVFGGRPQCFGDEARDYLDERIGGRRVRWAPGIERRDRYGRALVYLWGSGGAFVNAELVKGGFGRALTIRPNDRFARRFERLEQDAREAGRGLWSRCGRRSPPRG